MLHAPIIGDGRQQLDMPSLLEMLARSSSRPRYAFMVLNLIAQVSRSDGSAGPLVAKGGGLIPLRDWLCDALIPMGQRDPRRVALEERIRSDLAMSGALPIEAGQATAMVEDAIREQVRASGKTRRGREESAEGVEERAIVRSRGVPPGGVGAGTRWLAQAALSGLLR